MNVTTLSLLFASVIAGAIVVEIFKPKKGRNIQLLLTFSGAYLLAISLLHLLPELFANNPTEKIGIFILGGFLIQIFLEYFSQGIEHGHFHKSNVIPLLHKIPVAIVLMTFFLQSNMKKSRAYMLLFLFAIMAPLGVYSGDIFSVLSFYHNEILAIVIGIFLHISTTILFESTDGHRFSFTKIITIIVGTLLAIFSL